MLQTLQQLNLLHALLPLLLVIHVENLKDMIEAYITFSSFRATYEPSEIRLALNTTENLPSPINGQIINTSQAY